MHYAKYGKAAVGSILMHSDRGINGPDTHEHSNESIDRSRTHLNYDLKDRGGLTAYAYYKERIEKIAEETKQRTGKSIRKDAVTLCSWAVTVPKDLPEDKHADFFNAVYKWFSERYGEDNIVTAAVHMDETTPHMHLQFTPIIEKKGIRKLCAKECETKRTLGKVHQELQKHLVQELGCDVNILNGATDQGNKTVLQLQVGSLQEQVAAAEERVKAAEQELAKVKTQLKTTQAKLKTTHEKYKSASSELKTVLDQKSRASEIKTSLIFGGETVSYSKSMLERTRAIGSESYEQLIKAQKIREEVIDREQALTAREQAVNPLYDKAKQQQEQIQRELYRQQQITKNMQQEVERRATELTDQRIKRMFGDVSGSRAERLEDFCESVKYSDGQSVLDKFEEQEKQLKRRRNISL